MKVFERVSAKVSHDFLSDLKQQWQEISEESLILLIEGVAEKTGLALMVTTDQYWQFEGDWHAISKAKVIFELYAKQGVKPQLIDADVESLLQLHGKVMMNDNPSHNKSCVEVGVQTEEGVLSPTDWPQGPFITPVEKNSKSTYIPTGRPRGRPRKKQLHEGEILTNQSNPKKPSPNSAKEQQDHRSCISKEDHTNNAGGETEVKNSSTPGVHSRRTRKAVDYSLVETEVDVDNETEYKPGRKRNGRRKGVPYKRVYAKIHNKTSEGDLPRRRGRPRVFEPGTKWPCSKCDYISVTKSGLKNHEKRKHTDRRYDCKICNKSFGLQHDLQRHVKSHTEISVCEICGKQYKTPSQLIVHRQRHDPNYEKPEPVPCELCGKRFAGTISLKWHVESIHKGNRKTFLCNYCGKAFLAKTKMEDHENLHTGKRPYVCKVCSANFAHASSLSSHMLIHTGVKKYHCPTCNKAFRTSNNLRTHMQIHTGNPRFKCEVCGKAFYQKQALIRHRRIHTGEKPFQCEICGDKFNVKSILNRHLTGIHKLNLGPPGQPGRPIGSTLPPENPTPAEDEPYHLPQEQDISIMHSVVGSELGIASPQVSAPDNIEPEQTYLIHQLQQVPMSAMAEPMQPQYPVLTQHLDNTGNPQPLSTTLTPQTQTMQPLTSEATTTIHELTSSLTHSNMHTIQHKPTETESVQQFQRDDPNSNNLQYILPSATENKCLPPVTTSTNSSGTPSQVDGLVMPGDIHQIYPGVSQGITLPPVSYPVAPVTSPVTSKSMSPSNGDTSSASYKQASDMLATLAASMALHTMSAMGNQQNIG